MILTLTEMKRSIGMTHDYDDMMFNLWGFQIILIGYLILLVFCHTLDPSIDMLPFSIFLLFANTVLGTCFKLVDIPEVRGRSQLDNCNISWCENQMDWYEYRLENPYGHN